MRSRKNSKPDPDGCPGLIFTYADSFNGRFGVQISLSANSLFNEQSGVTEIIDDTIAARGPVINLLSFRDNPKITTHRLPRG